jgi:pimeloyl-ACP methyl ester carboxylesterase
MKLFYTRSGTPDAPAIVFLHGIAMGQWMWQAQIQHFADYDCYNVDLPGHGGSSQIAWDSFDQAADCVAQFIEADIVDKPVYLVGMSLGAMVGLYLLAHHQPLIKRAVLTGAIADAPPRWLIMLQGRIQSALFSTEFGKQLFARMLQLPSDIIPDYKQSIDALSIPAFKRIIQQLAVFSPPAGLEGVTVPTLFVTGEKDVAVNRHSVAVLAQRVPDAVGVYAPAVHHGWNGEDPVLFNAMTRAWIEAQPLPQSLIPAAS